MTIVMLCLVDGNITTLMTSLTLRSTSTNHVKEARFTIHMFTSLVLILSVIKIHTEKMLQDLM